MGPSNLHPFGAGLTPLLRNIDGIDLAAGDAPALARQFLSSDRARSKYLLGRNIHSAALIQCVAVDAVVDDYCAGQSWHGKPVITCADVPKDAIVVNCSMSISPISALGRLRKLGISGSIYYADLYRERPETIPLPGFVAETRADTAANENQWMALSNRLSDAASKKVLGDLLGYRLTADPRFMNDYSVRVTEQYFEDFLELKEEVFVDAGGYNGDTTQEFCRRYPDYREVFFFEPSSRNMRDARKRLALTRDIEFIEKGLSDATGTLGFDPEAGSASAVTAQSAFSIEVITLDAAVSRPVSFIKMDLEGWELKALHGCRGHILADHPKLAISVYHAAADFWRIPQYIQSIREDYDVYLRHYTEGWSETVMFFVPRKSPKPRAARPLTHELGEV